MNICQEYASRNNLFRDKFRVPCSYFLENEQDEKTAVTLYPTVDEDKFLVLHWDLMKIELTEKKILPSNKAKTYTKSQLARSEFIPDGFLPFRYQLVSTELSILPSPKVLPEERHIANFEQSLFSYNQRIAKTFWLWERFCHCTTHQGANLSSIIMDNFGIMKYQDQMSFVYDRLPRYWNNWDIHWLHHFSVTSLSDARLYRDNQVTTYLPEIISKPFS